MSDYEMADDDVEARGGGGDNGGRHTQVVMAADSAVSQTSSVHTEEGTNPSKYASIHPCALEGKDRYKDLVFAVGKHLDDPQISKLAHLLLGSKVTKQILGNNQHLVSLTFTDILQAWIDKEGNRATYGVLGTALDKIGLKNVRRALKAKCDKDEKQVDTRIILEFIEGKLSQEKIIELGFRLIDDPIELGKIRHGAQQGLATNKPSSITEQASEVLTKWMQTAEDDASVVALINAVNIVGVDELYEELLDILDSCLKEQLR